MKIIQPAHHTPASKVKNWKQIESEALDLREFIKHTDKLEGSYKSAFAISHAQVSENPKDFFVLNEDIKELIKIFGSWCVINIRILETKEPVWYNEACMSFPYRKPKRTDRFNSIKVQYRIPFFKWSRMVTRKLKGLSAFIAQHEIEHAQGKNIYFK